MGSGVCAVLLLIAAVPAAGQIADAWFPAHAGDRWIYEHTRREDNGGGSAHLKVYEWKTAETTIAVWTVPQGTVLERRVEVIDGAPPPGRRASTSAYLIRGGCLYAPEYGETGWDSSAHALTPYFLEGLRTYASPDLCFPLTVDKTWGAPHGLPDWGVTRPEDAKDWRVIGKKTHDPFAPERQDTFHVASISGYPGSGMTVDIWFEKGVGVVRQVEIHHGTIGEERTRLLSFKPAM
jgi:hypothetical protein